MSKKRRAKTSGDIVLDMRGLEIACATDGFMRGAPEPVVIAVVIAIEAVPRVVARALWRFDRPREAWPTTVGAIAPTRPLEQRYETDSDAPVVLLAVGIEEDDATDVQRVYAALERADAMSVWKLAGAGSIPSPVSLVQAATSGDLSAPARVRLLIDDADVGLACAGDDWVGACAVALPRRRMLASHRLHLADDAGVNDWT